VDIDKAVAKVLELKFRLGLFEDPYVDEDYAIALSKSEKHKALTIEAASQSIILLKNKNNILPLDKNKKMKIAVIGPNANDTRLGEYAGTPYYKRTVLEAIKEDFKAAEVVYSEGCKITENLLPD
jgi:beta-glucosidase